MTAEPNRILIVDDDEAARYVKSHLLCRQGYVVFEAGLARDALDLAGAKQPDLTLLDVKLPDASGIDVCRQIKSRFPHMIVLQTSAAFTGVADRTRALDGGADSYLVEPIEPDELVATVNALLRMRNAEQKVRTINRTLEELVAERTSELAEANRRLANEIADRRKAESVLWHTQKLDLIGQLTGGIAHDFNNLLTVISGNLELIHEVFECRVDPPSKSRSRLLRLLSTAQGAADHAAKITQRLLAFARGSTFTAEPLCVADLLTASEGFLRRAAGEAVVVTFSYAPNLWRCRIDPVQLEAAILNLVVNARDAMPKGGSLRIETANRSVSEASEEAESAVAPGDYVRMVVSDTGHGMAPEVVQRAFEPFFTTKEAGKGSGLGLSQIYGSITQSGGHVLIDSTLGEGTTFNLYLPRDLPRSEVSASPSATDNEHTYAVPGSGEKILIVDDNEDVREVAVVIVRSLGYEVLSAADATEAIALMRIHGGIDLLVSDIVMAGGVDGFDLARRARELNPSLPILLMSGYPANAGVAEACDFPILRKPYRRNELARQIRLALGDQIAPSVKEDLRLPADRVS
jgi:signal transduction histidine kinase